MDVDIFCVQPFMRADDYFTKEAFYHKIDRYFQSAKPQRTKDRPAIIVFPEDIATFLLLERQEDLLDGVHTMEEAFTAIGKKKTWPLLGTMVQYGTTRSKQAFFAHGATRVWHIWHGTMSRLAHDYNMTVVAGSALIPESRWTYDTNSYMPRSAKIYNFSFTVNPKGHVFYHTKKVNLVPTQEDVLELKAGPLDPAISIAMLPDTDVPMATAICYDAFVKPHTAREPNFVNVLEKLDQKGARLVAQPSANPWYWDEPWPFDPPASARLRRQQWDEEGSMRALEGCRNVEVVVNPQLLMDFLDIHFDGQSRILGRTGSTVQSLVASQATRGPDADCLLHTSWNFQPTGRVESQTTTTAPRSRIRPIARGLRSGSRHARQ